MESTGKYRFSPLDVVALEDYGKIPILYNGIRVVHNRLDCPEKIVFWCIGSREKMLKEIQSVGFHPNGKAVQRPGGIPVRWWFIVTTLIIWNALFFLDMSSDPFLRGQLGLSSWIAMVSVFALSTAIRLSRTVQDHVISPGHQIGEIKAILSLLQLVSGILALGFGLALFLR